MSKVAVKVELELRSTHIPNRIQHRGRVLDTKGEPRAERVHHGHDQNANDEAWTMSHMVTKSPMSHDHG